MAFKHHDKKLYFIVWWSGL